jgi:hypothetical protein
MTDTPEPRYRSQSARDAAKTYSASYCEYLDAAAQEHHDYYVRHGDPKQAEHMLTRSLGEALAGNDGV